MRVVRVVGELIFSTKIGEVCRTLGFECPVAKSIERLEEVLEGADDAIVLVDLGMSSGLGAALAGRAVQLVGADRVICFYSHVAHELAEQAKEQGATRVMPRSRFFDELPDLLTTSQSSRS